MVHKYPKDLVFELLALWRVRVERGGEENSRFSKLPDFEALEDLVSICYQVSQMQEEARGLRFRVMLCEPGDIGCADDTDAKSLFAISFAEPRPCNEYELLKLGPSIDYNNSLIGLRFSRSAGLQIWGLIHSGSRWVHQIHGGSKKAAPLPPALGINIVGSGRLIVCRGVEILAQLSSGNVIYPSTNVFQSRWVAEMFGRLQSELAALHQEASEEYGESWAKIDAAFIPALYLEVYKHVISTVRRSGHGGAIISVPDGMGTRIATDNPYIAVKYLFSEGVERHQLRNTVLQIMQELARTCGRLYGADYVAGWKDYVALQTRTMVALDEKIFKFARFVARLTGVDGVVVTTLGLDLIGFGGIIQGTFEMDETVARALDPEGVRREVEPVENVGARHRSLYYLCSQLRDIFGVIVSQDAKASVVHWNREMVTCWDVIPIDFA